MASLYLIRHGQASFLADNYDQLSSLGHKQSYALGDFLGKKKLIFDQVYTGAMVRHIETFESSQQNYQVHNGPMVEPLKNPNLNEHQATDIFKANMGKLLDQDQALKNVMEEKGMQDREVRTGYLKLFFKGIRLWAKGELNAPGFETYKEFSERVKEAYAELTEAMMKSDNVIAFTSGGTISMLIGIMLKLQPEDIVDFNWQTRNTGITEFHFSRTNKRFFLRSFNETPHLEAEHITYV